jgi:hypothetical protein
MLIQWLIPFHLIEQYAEFLNSTDGNNSNNLTICNCTENQFSVKCEYELVSRQLSIATIIKDQQDSKFEPY